jgi:phenylacetate-CoA ligase
MREFQFDRFLSIYRHALLNIPFYKKCYGEHGLNENSIKSPEDITKIPILTKQNVRENVENLMWPTFPKKKISFSRTGGTTGQPLHIYMAKKTYSVYNAFIDDIWKRMGYKPSDLKIILARSEHLRFIDGIHQHYNPKKNFLCLSISDLTKDMVKKYIEVFKKKSPKFLVGYSATLFILAQIIRELNASVPPIKGINCHSQKLLAGQREIIEEVFGGRVFSHYGMAERVTLAAECEYSHDYHIVPEYGYTELINGKGEVIETPGVSGELVGTSFYNKVMPLIRYRTGDLAAYRKDQTCECGRPHTILSNLVGRTQDFLVLEDGTLKGTTPGVPVFSIFSDYCRGFQFVQEVPGLVEVRIVPKSDNPEGYKKIICNELEEKYFGSLKFELVETSSLEKTSSGKTKFLIQKLKTPLDHQEESVTYWTPED